MGLIPIEFSEDDDKMGMAFTQAALKEIGKEESPMDLIVAYIAANRIAIDQLTRRIKALEADRAERVGRGFQEDVSGEG